MMARFKLSRKQGSTSLKSSAICTLLMAVPATPTHTRLGPTARVVWGWLNKLPRERLTASAHCFKCLEVEHFVQSVDTQL